MKHRMMAALLSVVLCISLAGCTAAPDFPQPTLEELLAEVNAEHQSIQQPSLDWSAYIRSKPDEAALEKYSIGAEGLKACDPDAVLTAAQAAEDVEYLFGAFEALYGPYDYLGGKEVFDAHKAEILTRCAEQESWTVRAFRDMVMEGLCFLPDAHFNINGSHTNQFEIPFFFRETAFYKTDAGYQTADGRTVRSVDNHPDLDALFKRSISPEGEIVYYPILLEPREDPYKPQYCSETLTVRFYDGSSALLAAEPFQPYGCEKYKELGEGTGTNLRQTEEIPVFEFDLCDIDHIKEIVSGAAAIKEEPVAMLDLRANPGGNTLVGDNWLEEYCGQSLPGNLRRFSFNAFEGGISEREKWVEQENILIVLTSKFVASASEGLVDQAHDLENVLFVGENTGGFFLASAANRFQLPNSCCLVTMGDGYVSPVYGGEGYYFREFEGLYPDFWVPAAEAEDLAAKLIRRLSTSAAE